MAKLDLHRFDGAGTTSCDLLDCKKDALWEISANEQPLVWLCTDHLQEFRNLLVEKLRGQA